MANQPSNAELYEQIVRLQQQISQLTGLVSLNGGVEPVSLPPQGMLRDSSRRAAAFQRRESLDSRKSS